MSRLPPGTVALVMAGGRGERMGATLTSGPVKPLVCARGVPLVERALFPLIGAGIRHVVVATRASRPELAAFAATRMTALAQAMGVTLEVFEESEPLGTIGAVRVAREAPCALVVNADNLTDLDVGGLVERHASSGVAMTVATHVHDWAIPYAVVETVGRRVTGYREKPILRQHVASAVYVLGPAAVAMAASEPRMDAPDLVRRLLAAGLPVDADSHQAVWFDVNDAATLARAEAALAVPGNSLELWSPRIDVEVVGCLVLDDRGCLLERRPEHASAYPSVWDTPGGKLEQGETPEQALRRELIEELAWAPAAIEPLASFDDIDLRSRRVFRHHVFVTRERADIAAREGQTLAWFPLDALPDDLAVPAARSLAARGTP